MSERLKDWIAYGVVWLLRIVGGVVALGFAALIVYGLANMDWAAEWPAIRGVLILLTALAFVTLIYVWASGRIERRTSRRANHD